ncbi:MAG: antibiotic biosynthesis monooxygenase [Gammaproteobacteria bacterium]|jgi:heme-degrading monooxygenase HmoA
MYAVIFRALLNSVDDAYFETAARLRQLATDNYGCIEFTAVTEGTQEIAISYWASLEQIKAWKQDPEHHEAQKLGRERWYKQYQVQIVKVEKEYRADQL